MISAETIIWYLKLLVPSGESSCRIVQHLCTKAMKFCLMWLYFWTNLISTIKSTIEVFHPNMVAVLSIVWVLNGMFWNLLVPFGILLWFNFWCATPHLFSPKGDFYQPQWIYIVCSYILVWFWFFIYFGGALLRQLKTYPF